MRRIGFFKGEVIVAAVVVVVVVMVELINKGGYTSISPPHFFAQNTLVFGVFFSVSIFEFRDVLKSERDPARFLDLGILGS